MNILYNKSLYLLLNTIYKSKDSFIPLINWSKSLDKNILYENILYENVTNMYIKKKPIYNFKSKLLYTY